MKGNEAEYIIPLRKEVMKVAKYDRTKKAVIAVRQYLQKHTKSKNVLLGKELNKRLQKGGRKNVVAKVHVKVLQDEDKYRAELIGFPIELTKDKEDKKKGKKEDKTEKTKVLEKDNIKEEKIEKPAPKEEPKKEVAEKVRQEKIVKKSEKPKNEKKK
ncbi:hypothetical protein HOF78_02040 [Candidatus Woesearchaeota archaeon]|jgi:ribosomal protein L31E|nr:hypothetical protein [Candidatus Woesearchaeota archaeon]MBT6044690.1 hypothetical protein [Candidatus Woesearchaeota archaeon]